MTRTGSVLVALLLMAAPSFAGTLTNHDGEVLMQLPAGLASVTLDTTLALTDRQRIAKLERENSITRNLFLMGSGNILLAMGDLYSTGDAIGSGAVEGNPLGSDREKRMALKFAQVVVVTGIEWKLLKDGHDGWAWALAGTTWAVQGALIAHNYHVKRQQEQEAEQNSRIVVPAKLVPLMPTRVSLAVGPGSIGVGVSW